MKAKRNLLLAPWLLLLSSCSAVDIAYNNAPSWVGGKIDDAFNLNGNQRQQLDTQLQSFFRWHHEQELQRYQVVLDQAARHAEDGISVDEFLELNHQVEKTWDRTVTKAIDEFGDLASSINPAQIKHFRFYYLEKSEKHDDYLEKTPQQRNLHRARRSLDRLEGWYGDFDDDLSERVITRLQQLPDIYQPWEKYRGARHQALIEVLEKKPNQIKRELRRVLLSNDTTYAQEFEPARKSYRLAYANALEEINGWLSPMQRQKVVKKLQDYSQIAARLSKG
jgi:hypothetical protein